MTQPVPASWPELAAARTSEIRARLPKIAEIPEMAARVKPPLKAASVVSAGTRLLEEGVVLLGPDETTPHAALLAPLVPRAFADWSPSPPGRSNTARCLLSLVNTLELHGIDVAPSNHALLADQLENLATPGAPLADPCKLALAFGTVTFGRPAFVTAFAGTGAPPTPGRSYGFDVFGVARHLAHARAEGWSADAWMPAWNGFVDAFPAKLAAGTVEWNDLSLAARAALGTLGGAAPREVAAQLRAAVLARI